MVLSQTQKLSISTFAYWHDLGGIRRSKYAVRSVPNQILTPCANRFGPRRGQAPSKRNLHPGRQHRDRMLLRGFCFLVPVLVGISGYGVCGQAKNMPKMLSEGNKGTITYWNLANWWTFGSGVGSKSSGQMTSMQFPSGHECVDKLRYQVMTLEISVKCKSKLVKTYSPIIIKWQ